MKLFLLVTVGTHYVLNCVPYCGRDVSGQNHVGLVQDVVKELLLPFHKSGVNVTTDNYFTSAELASDLATKDITLLGTMPKCRREIPGELRKPSGRTV